jgi:hypothetical protein
VNTVVCLFDQFIRARVFSYKRYLRRLVTRGTLSNTNNDEELTEVSCTQMNVGKHNINLDYTRCQAEQKQREIARMLPVHDPQSATARQRRIQLYGVNNMVGSFVSKA